MSDPFISQISIYSFYWPPVQYAKCDGQIMEITQNQALYSLLGTNFGGNGTTTFGLPDLRGRAPVHLGAYGIDQIGQYSGFEFVTLDDDTMALHTHNVRATTSVANSVAPHNLSTDEPLMLAEVEPNKGTKETLYGQATHLTELSSETVSSVGTGQAHYNMQPYLVINFCIALKGTYPPRN